MSQHLSMRSKGFLISTGLIVIILIIEVFIRDDVFNASLPVIHSLQTKLPKAGSQVIFHAAASLANPEYVLFVFLLIMAIQINKYFLVKIGIYICFVGYFLSVIKTIYASPRPYWVRPKDADLPGYVAGEEIEPYEKYAEYGNPSGHAFFTIALYGYLFYFFVVQHKRNVRRAESLHEPLNSQERIDIHDTDYKNVDTPAEQAAGLQTTPSRPLSRNWYIAMNVLFLVVMGLVCLSRLYLGMHAINQVCLGLCLGTYTMYFFINFIDGRLEDFLKKIARQELTNRPMVIWSLSVCYFLVSLLPVALFIQNSSRNVVTASETWNKWWVVVHNELKTEPNAFAYNRCFLDSGVIGGFFGILLGCLCSDGSYTETAPKINTIPKTKILFRVIVFFVVSAFIPGILQIIHIPTQNYILTYFLKFNLALFMAGFSCMKFVPIAYNKLGLEIEGDFLQLRKKTLDEKSANALLAKGP